MKYFIPVFLFLSFAGPALAAQPAGSIPDLPPLQPPPANVGASVSSNIQRVDLAHPTPPPNPTGVLPVKPAAQKDASPYTDSGQPYKKSSAWIWWALAILAVVGGGVWVIRKSQNE